MTIEEQTAINFYNQAMNMAPNPKSGIITAKMIKDYRVVWDGETVHELATGRKISEHNWNKKIQEIDDLRNKFLEGKIENTDKVLVVKDTNHEQYLIIDGVHRLVGYYKAYLIDPSIEHRNSLRYLLFESEKVIELADYKRLFS